MEPFEQPHNQRTGALGEDMALAYLEKKGYKMVERNYRAGKVEIDLIVSLERLLVFVEVKCRFNAIIEPEQAVDRSKQLKIANAANSYLIKRNIIDPVRFDIVTVHFRQGKTEITHFEDAFYPVFYR